MRISRSRSLQFVALAAVGAAVGFGLWHRSPEISAPASPFVVESAPDGFGVSKSPVKHELVQLSATAATASMASPVRPSRSGLGRELLDAKDLKAFVVHALTQLDKGGAFYAGFALNQCDDSQGSLKEISDATIQRVIARESTISVERMEAIRSLERKCAGFAPGEVQAFTKEAVGHALDGTDPLSALTPYISQDYRRPENIEGVLKSGNAALISSSAIPVRFISELRYEPMRLVYRYNGQTIADPAEQTAIRVGALLSTCSENDYCMIDDFVSDACKWQGECYASRDEYVRQHRDQLNGDAAAYEMALKYRDEMRAAIRRGDLSLFR